MHMEVIQIERLAQGGEGMGRMRDGRVVFVPGALPGERIEARVVSQQKSMARAVVHRIVEPSSARRDSACPWVSQGCGGCQFWHADYAAELHHKSAAAWQTLQRLGRVALPEAYSVTASPSETGYRNRAIFHVRPPGKQARGVAGHPAELGFFTEQTHRMVPVTHCLVLDPLLNEVRRGLEQCLKGLGAGELLLETSSTESVVVSYTGSSQAEASSRALTDWANDVMTIPRVAGVRWRAARHRGSLGDPTICASVALACSPTPGARLPSGMFRQANVVVNQQMVAHVRSLVASLGRPRVLELFCGAGNFSFALASVVESLLGLEGHGDAVQTARQLAACTEWEHLAFQEADLLLGYHHALEAHPAAPDFDVVVLDPPRTGARGACEQIAADRQAKAIAYVSCDPACLARDLAILAGGGYAVGDVRFFDMFPRTAHIETVVWLTRGAAGA